MSESPNLNINNYSIEELLNILDINYPINEEQLLEHGKGYIEKYIAENQPEFAAFFAKALEKLINSFEEIEAILDPPKITEDQYAENILQNQYYDDGSEVQQKASKIPNRSNNVSVINDQHSIQSQGRIYPINDTRVVPLAQGRLNPILKNTYTSLLNIDSHYREIITNSNSTSCDFNSTSTAITILDTSTDFTFNLTEDIPEVVSMTVGSLELPMNAYYPISDKYGTNFFKIEKEGKSCCLTLPAGFYPNVAPTSDTSNGIWNYQSYELDNIPNDLRGWNLQSIINYNITQCTFADMNLFGINLKPMFYNLTIPNRIRVNLKPQFAFKQGYEARIENIHTMTISNDVTIEINPQIIISNRQFIILEFPDITYVDLKTNQDLSDAELSGFYIEDGSGASVGTQAYLGNATDPSGCKLAEKIETIDASGGYWGQKQPVTRRIKLKDVSGVIFDNTANNIGLKIPITGSASAVLDISYTEISSILDIQRELGKTDLNTQVKQGYNTWLSRNIKFYNPCEIGGNDIDNPTGSNCYQQYWKYDISFNGTIDFTDDNEQGKLVKYARIWQDLSGSTTPKIEGVVLDWNGSSDGSTADNITVGVGYQVSRDPNTSHIQGEVALLDTYDYGEPAQAWNTPPPPSGPHAAPILLTGGRYRFTDDNENTAVVGSSAYTIGQFRTITFDAGLGNHTYIKINSLFLRVSHNGILPINWKHSDRLGILASDDIMDLSSSTGHLNTTIAPVLSKFLFQTTVTTPATGWSDDFLPTTTAAGGWLFPPSSSFFLEGLTSYGPSPTNGNPFHTLTGQWLEIKARFVRFYFYSPLGNQLWASPGWDMELVPSPPYLFDPTSSINVKVGNDVNVLADPSWNSGNFIIRDASINPISDNALVVTAKGKVSYWDWEFQTYTRMYIQQEFTYTNPFIFGEKIWIEGLKYGLGGRPDKGGTYMIWENGSTFPFGTWSPIETVTAEGKIVGWNTGNHPYKVPSIAIELTTVGTFDTQKPISFTNTSGIADFTISDVSNVRFSQDIVHKRGDKIKQGDVTGTLVTDQINPSFKIYVTDIDIVGDGFKLPTEEDPSGVKPFIIQEVSGNGVLTGRETTIIPVYKNNPIDKYQSDITAAVGNTVTQIIPNPPGSDPANTIISGTLKTALIQGDKGITGEMVNSVIETQNETDQFVDTENIIIVDDNGSSIIFAVKSGGISSPADITAPAGTIVTQGGSLGTIKYSVVPPASTFIITAANGQTFNSLEGMNIGTTFIESTTIESVVALQNFSQSADSRVIQFQSVGTLMCSVQNPVEEVVISYDGSANNVFSTTGGHDLQIGTTVIPQEYILDISIPVPFNIPDVIPAGTSIGQGQRIGRLQKAITKDSVEIILTYENIAANSSNFNLNINFIIGDQLIPPNTFACIESVKNPVQQPIGSIVTQNSNQGTLYIVEPTTITADGTIAHASIVIEVSQGTFSAGGITIISNDESEFYLTTIVSDTTYPPIFDPQKQLANINDTVTQKNISSSALASSMTGDTSEILIKVQPDVVITSTNDITIISTATAKTFTIEAVFISSSTAQYQRFSAPQFSTVVQDGSIGKVQKGVDNTDAGPNPGAVSRIVISGEENSSFSADEDIVLSNNDIIEGRYILSVTVFSGLQMVITPNTQKTSFINNTGSEITLTFYSNNCDTDECFPTDKCLMGNRGAKIDSNLGWLLGFRQPKYVIQPGSFITSEATVNPWGTRYLLLEVDDLNRNRNTGNLISMSSKKDKLKLPEYYKKTRELYPACPPAPCSDISGINFKISKLPQKASYQKRSSRKGVPAGTLLIDGSNNLTKAQKYTITEIMNRRKKQNQIRYNAPVNTNILYRAPLQRNSSNILSGNAVPLIVKNDAGSETARRYFGPIILKTLKIKLLNDKGYPIDLRADWSCDLKIERKYQF